MKKRLWLKALFLISQIGAVFASTSVDFYATESSSQDQNMIQMTTDLFYSQFQTINGYVVVDKRKDHFDIATATSEISFYAEIQESPEGGWICTLNAIKTAQNKNVSSTKRYESYYKILMDAKPSLENLLGNLTGTIQTLPVPQEKQDAPHVQKEMDIETLAGTWAGENFIDKILILRSGKGIIIYKNGASMNVEITVNGNNVKVKQTGRSNASYFPELPRPVALKNAASAEPIEWNLVYTNGILKGTKRTLIHNESSSQEVEYGTTSVTWQRRN